MQKRWRKGLAMTALAGLLAIMPPQMAYAGEVGVITAMSEKVYLENSTESTVLANILQGTSVEVILSVSDESGAVWYYIRTDTGLEGYMPAQSMSIVEQTQPEDDAGAEVVEEQEPQPEEPVEEPQQQEVVEEIVAEEQQQITEETQTTEPETETVASEPETVTVQTEQPVAESQVTSETALFEVSTESVKEQSSGFHLELFEVVLIAGIVCCVAAIIFLIGKIKQMLMK